MSGVKLVHVPYKGMAASNLGVMTGQIQLGFPSFTSAFPHVKAGKLKAFAITTRKRSALAPDIPTMDEAGVPGYEASIWNGVLAPAGTPKAIVHRLHEAIVQILKSPQAVERYANVGAEIRYNSPEEFAALIRAELAKWAKVVKATGIRVDDR
jgi:tripartite-type tricarboxylate transporter receptor subunit TctC